MRDAACAARGRTGRDRRAACGSGAAAHAAAAAVAGDARCRRCPTRRAVADARQPRPSLRLAADGRAATPAASRRAVRCIAADAVPAGERRSALRSRADRAGDEAAGRCASRDRGRRIPDRSVRGQAEAARGADRACAVRRLPKPAEVASRADSAVDRAAAAHRGAAASASAADAGAGARPRRQGAREGGEMPRPRRSISRRATSRCAARSRSPRSCSTACSRRTIRATSAAWSIRTRTAG